MVPDRPRPLEASVVWRASEGVPSLWVRQSLAQVLRAAVGGRLATRYLRGRNAFRKNRRDRTAQATDSKAQTPNCGGRKTHSTRLHNPQIAQLELTCAMGKDPHKGRQQLNVWFRSGVVFRATETEPGTADGINTIDQGSRGGKKETKLNGNSHQTNTPFPCCPIATLIAAPRLSDRDASRPRVRQTQQAVCTAFPFPWRSSSVVKFGVVTPHSLKVPACGQQLERRLPWPTYTNA